MNIELPDVRVEQLYQGRPMCCYLEIYFSLNKEKKRFSLGCFFCRKGLVRQTGVLFKEISTDGQEKVYFEVMDSELWDMAWGDRGKFASAHQAVSMRIDEIVEFIKSKIKNTEFLQAEFESLKQKPVDEILNAVLQDNIDKDKKDHEFLKKRMREDFQNLLKIGHPITSGLKEALLCIQYFGGQVNGLFGANALWHHHSCYDIECKCRFCLQKSWPIPTCRGSKTGERPAKLPVEETSSEEPSSDRKSKGPTKDFDLGPAIIGTIATGSLEAGLVAGFLFGDDEEE